jgi:hypothetical protein
VDIRSGFGHDVRVPVSGFQKFQDRFPRVLPAGGGIVWLAAGEFLGEGEMDFKQALLPDA